MLTRSSERIFIRLLEEANAYTNKIPICYHLCNRYLLGSNISFACVKYLFICILYVYLVPIMNSIQVIYVYLVPITNVIEENT